MSYLHAFEEVKLQCTPLVSAACAAGSRLSRYAIGMRLTFALLLIVSPACSHSCTALKIAIVGVHHADAEGTHQHH